ncbi:MAG: pilus (MSHA type) biogenesis protein MshL [Gammaproteobacteria bacterium]|nr:pilus (MSHA type) biogenesis protein MshL [Gammaproteobacteria bacterium]
MRRVFIVLFAGLVCAGCEQLEPKPFEPSPGHISADEPVAGQPQIPELVQQAPELPEPGTPEEQEKYTVVVHEVPVNEILFALARDAKINVDIDPRVAGVVTLNAVDQNLTQLLERISRQVPIRYEMSDGNLFIMPDEPYFQTYKINYVNMARDSEIKVKIDTQVSSAGGGGGAPAGAGGGSSSSTEVASVSNNRFWNSLVANVQAILSQEEGGAAGGGAAGAGGGELPVTENVIPHAESGLLTVKATASQHKMIQELIDNTIAAAHRQVLIQATIVEVNLNKDYQAGIDWSFLSEQGKAGFNFTSLATSAAAGIVPLGTPLSFVLSYVDPNTGRDRINATVRLLEQFGNVNVLSSPQIMALNNQTAVLKVVDNEVYFSVNVESETTQTGIVAKTIETEIHTVPVGIVLSVTPQVNENDSIILQVRPTVSRVREFVNDPNPELDEDTPNPVPVIQTREMESVLRMNNGQIAVLGGLMEDRESYTDTSVPGLSRLPVVGDAFKTRVRDHAKSELVVFLRPVVIRNPSLEADLGQYKTFLQRRQ